jgi:hypothetical protein
MRVTMSQYYNKVDWITTLYYKEEKKVKGGIIYK